MQNSFWRQIKNRPMPPTGSVMRQSISNFRLYCCSKKIQMLRKKVKLLLEQLQVCIFAKVVFGVRCTLSPVYSNPFSNETGAVLLRFQKYLHPHWSFSYRFRPSTLQRASREKPNGTVCSPFWILTVEWAGARSCLFGWRHRFQIASFSPSTLGNSVFKKHGFQIAPLWGAFSNDPVFGDRFRRCSVDDSRIRSKTAPFSFENG